MSKYLTCQDDVSEVGALVCLHCHSWEVPTCSDHGPMSWPTSEPSDPSCMCTPHPPASARRWGPQPAPDAWRALPSAPAVRVGVRCHSCALEVFES